MCAKERAPGYETGGIQFAVKGVTRQYARERFWRLADSRSRLGGRVLPRTHAASAPVEAGEQVIVRLRPALSYNGRNAKPDPRGYVITFARDWLNREASCVERRPVRNGASTADILETLVSDRGRLRGLTQFAFRPVEPQL